MFTKLKDFSWMINVKQNCCNRFNKVRHKCKYLQILNVTRCYLKITYKIFGEISVYRSFTCWSHANWQTKTKRIVQWQPLRKAFFFFCCNCNCFIYIKNERNVQCKIRELDGLICTFSYTCLLKKLFMLVHTEATRNNILFTNYSLYILSPYHDISTTGSYRVHSKDSKIWS